MESRPEPPVAVADSQTCDYDDDCGRRALWEDTIYRENMSLSNPEEPGPDAYFTCQEHHDELWCNVPRGCAIDSIALG